MKFATSKEHRDFFQKHGWIEFEELISDEQLSFINQAIDQVLAERLKVPLERLYFSSSEKFYLQGRDVWRSHPVLQKLATQTRFAEIAVELIEKKPLRLGYDQLFPARHQMPSQETSVYSQFLQQTSSLQDVSCLQDIACGVLLSLGKKEMPDPEQKALTEGIDIFPNQPGQIIFFQPQVLVDWRQIYAHLGQRFYLIAYTFANSHYQLQPKDPHTHALKRLGYVINDKLSDKLNPIIYR